MEETRKRRPKCCELLLLKGNGRTSELCVMLLFKYFILRAFFLEGELKTADALAERKRLWGAASRAPASVAAGATDEQQQHHDNAAAAPSPQEQRNDDDNGGDDGDAAPVPAPDAQQR